MAEPREFRIVQNLQAALRGIAVADGYHFDVNALAVKLDPNENVETLIGATPLRPFVILELDPDAVTIEFAPKGIRIVMPLLLHAVTDSDPTVDDSWLQTYFRLCADLEQAIAQDITRGGLAVTTKVLSRSLRTLNGAQVWAQVAAQVDVIRTFGVPN